MPVVGCRVVNGRDLLLLEELPGAANRRRYRAFDRRAGRGGAERRLLILPRDAASRQHVEMVERASRYDTLFATIRDFQVMPDELVIVMDWVTGPTLRDYLTEVVMGRVARPSIREAYRLGRSLAHRVSRLHRRSFLVHGDLNPANLIYHRDSGQLVLIDFGSAWGIEQSLAHDAGDGIRPVYSAPETFETHAVRQEFADQFVVSLLTYQMLTLKVPYEGYGGAAGKPQHRDDIESTWIPPSQLHPDRSRMPRVVYERLDRALERGLKLKPGERFPTSQAWLNELDAVWHIMNHPNLSQGINEWVGQWIETITSWLPWGSK